MFARTILIGALLFLPAMAGAQTFTDLPQNDPAFAAAQYLKQNGILQGYSDGTFRALQEVNRAEALKIIVGDRLHVAEKSIAIEPPFADVPADAWFAPFAIEAYSTLRIVDGPPTTKYLHPEKAVTRGEFLKMLLLAYDVDPISSYSEILYPFSSDVSDSGAWFYPYVRYGLTASMIQPSKALLEPGETLTRGDVAQILYNFLLYREGKRTQTLLSASENEILTVFRMIESEATDEASYAAGRAVLAARGALASQPNDNTTKATVKTAEASLALAQASSLLKTNTLKSIDHAGTAWHLAEKGRDFSSALDALAEQVQKVATALADQARQQPAE